MQDLLDQLKISGQKMKPKFPIFLYLFIIRKYGRNTR